VTKHGMWEGDVLKEGGELSITFGDGHVYIGDHFDERPHGELTLATLLWSQKSVFVTDP
jgi:hypothetical protein